jgi:uncharacterized protein (TIGR04255 family)
VANDEFFPDSQRVFYEKAPLKQVICQFRFPIIYRIEKEVPSEFQEQIRGRLPISERIDPFVAPFQIQPLQIPKQIADALGAASLTHTYRFLTEDRLTSVELTSSSLTCQTTAYTLWDRFVDLVSLSKLALTASYKPSFFDRIGLRYVDVIDKDALGLNDVPWSALLNKSIIGELAEQFIEDNIENVQKSIRVKDSDKLGGFLLQHGISLDSTTKKQSYYIDFDFYADTKTELKDVDTILDRLHSRTGNAWRWCITNELHNALNPQPIPS